MRLPTRIITGFLDDTVNQLLCVEDQREAAIAMAAIGAGSSKDIIAPSQQENEVDRISPPIYPKDSCFIEKR